MNYYKSLIKFGLALCVLFLVDCRGVGTNEAVMPNDSVAVNVTTLKDTTCFNLSQGGKCNILANATITYPDKFKDKITTEKLQKLFADFVLDAGDSVSFDSAIKNYAKMVINQYGSEDSDAPYDDEDCDDETVYRYNSDINISVVFNADNIITFCKEETVKKNGEVTMQTHNYYNFDLESMTLIDLPRLFKEESYDDITKLLKSNLMSQNHVKTEAELNDLGYYNLDNLTLTNNFFFTKDKIVWSYEPNELAIASVGEPQIGLSVESMQNYLCDNSVLLRLI